MPHTYLVPIVMWLPPGRRSTMILPQKILKDCLVGGTGRVCREWVVYRDGEVADRGSDVFDFTPTAPAVNYSAELSYDMPADAPSSGYLECTIRSDDETALFKVMRLPGTYNIHSSPTGKSFFTCHTHKFASPPVISQIARFGQFVDCYPVITVDKAADRTTSLVFVNPYGKNIVAKVFSYDGRKIEGIKIKPHSACRVDMAGLLRDGEDSWGGHIQLTANNRALTWLVKHRISIPGAIATAEHLDPYRADETHMPLARALRNWVGHWLERRQAQAAHRRTK
jgi:hypothetical protein